MPHLPRARASLTDGRGWAASGGSAWVTRDTTFGAAASSHAASRSTRNLRPSLAALGAPLLLLLLLLAVPAGFPPLPPPPPAPAPAGVTAGGPEGMVPSAIQVSGPNAFDGTLPPEAAAAASCCRADRAASALLPPSEDAAPIPVLAPGPCSSRSTCAVADELPLTAELILGCVEEADGAEGMAAMAASPKVELTMRTKVLTASTTASLPEPAAAGAVAGEERAALKGGSWAYPGRYMDQ